MSGAEKRIVIRTQSQGDQIMLQFGDTGIGIDPDDVPQIFDPFFTKKGVQGGGNRNNPGLGPDAGALRGDGDGRAHLGGFDAEQGHEHLRPDSRGSLSARKAPMPRWAWIFPLILIAAVAVSLLRRAPATAGEQLLTAMETHHFPTREALLLLDYSPDRDLLAAARVAPVERGAGPAPGLGIEPTASADQHWIRVLDATLFWPRPKELRAALPEAISRMRDLLDAPALSAAVRQLQNLTDEQLFLAWIHADRGVLSELSDATDAAQQALLLESGQNRGPVLTFPVGDEHVYLLPDENTADATWCDLAVFKNDGSLEWCAVLRLDAFPPPQHVRTMAVLLAEAALTPPATAPATPQLMRY